MDNAENRRLLPRADARAAPRRRLSVGVILPYGEAREGFFPDALLELCCAEARGRGHEASLVRVYYDGRDRGADRAIGRRLHDWLAARNVDVVVIERLFDPAPIAEHVRAAPGRRAVMLSWGDGDILDGVDLVVGRTPGVTRAGSTRRSPTAGEIVGAFGELLDALADGREPTEAAGVARVTEGGLVHGPPAHGRPLPRPFRPVVVGDVIATGTAPVQTRKYLFGNAGCPFADDPVDNPHYAALEIPNDGSMSRLGCAFCHAGGDYQKRADEEVVAELIEQATFYRSALPHITDFVLIDQYSIRYLERLVRAASEARLTGTRWLFSSRADAFVRELPRIRAAVVAARECRQVLEVYLSGFEAFSDSELARYNKGATVEDLLAAVGAMRTLAREAPGVFEFARARGHSMILWNPWTRVEDVLQTTDNVRRHGLLELFDEIGRNRLRLYPDLPIARAAERDGAVLNSWEAGDEGAARRKGYSVERPWRFLDSRTRLAHALSDTLRDALGATTELGQLRAASEYAQIVTSAPGEVAARVASVMADVGRLQRVLAGIADGTAGTVRPARVRAVQVRLVGVCNNGCETCAQGDAGAPDDTASAQRRVTAARASGLPVLLAGREPLIRADILDLVRLAHGDDRRNVGVVTNGRRFAYRGLANALATAGLRSASVKLFSPSPEQADAITRDPGAHDQALAGIAALATDDRIGLEVRAPVHRLSLHVFGDYAALAQSLGVRQIRVEVALDAVGLNHLAQASAAVERLEASCASLGVALDASELGAGTVDFTSMPDLHRRAP